MHKVFISYHHQNDQPYKERLLEINNERKIFIDGSVDTGDVSDDLSDSAIREKIRDEYLRDSTVTILLVGLETKLRKHVDWEIYSSMYDGTVNKKSGIFVITLPSVNCDSYYISHFDEKKFIYPDSTIWETNDNRAELENRFPYLPDRIIDNLLKKEAKVSITNWDKIENHPDKLAFLVDATFNDREVCKYDLSQPMRRSNS